MRAVSRRHTDRNDWHNIIIHMHLLTRPSTRRRASLAFAALILAPATALAGGMALTMQNGSQLGNTFSGAAAAEDASTVYFNPAGLTHLTHGEVAIAASYVIFDTQFTNTGSTTAGVLPGSGTNARDGGVDKLIPVAYIAYPISDTFAVGFGLSAPYGLATDYPSDWVGRYHALKSELVTVNASLAAAWRVTRQLSLGFGIDRQSADAELTNAIDIGLIGFANSIPGFAPGSADAHVRIKGKDTRTGFNIGAIYEIVEGTRIGVHFRSRMDHVLTGQARFHDVAAPFDGTFFDQRVRAPLTLPEVFSLSLAHHFTPDLAVFADWSFWKWNRFSALNIDFESPLTPDFTQQQDWKDASIVSLGVRWQRSDRLTLRGGLALNKTPVPSPERRTARIPDSDRTWVGVGAGWQFSSQLHGEFGYAHLFMEDARIANDDGAGHMLIGRFESSATILSAQLTWTY